MIVMGTIHSLSKSKARRKDSIKPTMAYCHDCMTLNNSGMTLVTTVEYKQVILLWKIQPTMRYPSLNIFVHLVQNNFFRNCPINREDVVAVEDIFGPNLVELKGKTTYTGPEHVQRYPSKYPTQYHKRVWQDYLLR